MQVDGHSTYFYRRLPTGSSHNFKARDQIMAAALNEMVSLYKPEVLCPQIAGVNDAGLRQRRFCEYLMKTFYRQAAGAMVQCGDCFRRYGDYYKQQLAQIAEAGPDVHRGRLVGSVRTL